MKEENMHTAESESADSQSDMEKKNIKFFIEMYRLYESVLIDHNILEKAQQLNEV